MAEKTVKVKIKEECPYCGGKGYTQEEGKGIEGFHRCHVCKGDGILKSEQSRTVNIVGISVDKDGIEH